MIGTKPYDAFAEDYRKPVVIAGFEPLDVMQAILMLVRQINEGRHEVENEYIRAVTLDGNLKAQEMVAEVFELRDTFEWRGLGWVAESALQMREEFAAFDAEKVFAIKTVPAKDNPACECGAILRGVKKPVRLQAVRHAVHAGDADGLLHGVLGGLLRRALDLWPLPRHRKAGVVTAPRLRSRKLDIKNGRVDLSHGSGGRAMAQLIADIFHDAFANDLLSQGNDQAVFDIPAGRMAMTTDGYVVSPLFFPGGDIGSLAVHGTVNDLAMAGAVPLHLSASFILEEGFPLADLQRIARSMGEAAREAGVTIVTGDTKVVERGKADGVFISTAGIGLVPEGLRLSGDQARPGDAILVSGTMGDHGVAIMSSRENLQFETEIVSDSAALHGLTAAMVAACGPDLRLMRDPTRGGLAATLNEIAHQSGVGIRISEDAIPIKPQVAAACELLGLDPLYVANEGKLVAFVAPEAAQKLLAVMRAHPLGRDAAMIGHVVADEHRFVQMTTSFGGGRIVDWLSGEQLPRIC